MPTYSHSRLSAYEACPLKYRYAYVDRLEPERLPENVEAFMGKRVHEALHKLYSGLMRSRRDTLDDVLAYYDEAWDRQWSDGVEVVRKGATLEEYREQGRRCLRDYFSRYAPFDGDKTLGLEMKLFIRIDGYRLIGYVDRIAIKKGRLEIHDYKTSRSVPPQSFFEEDRQLALYQIGARDIWREAEHVDLVWHYLIQGLEVRSTRTPEKLEELKSSIAALIRRIERAEREYDFPAVVGGLCAWCEYRYLCPFCGRQD